MINSNRLFVPLATEPFVWFESGNKSWELRKYGRQFTEKTVYEGRRVELRCGYSDPNRSIWGTISKVEKSKTIEDFFTEIDFSIVIPVAQSNFHAIQIAKTILGINDNNEFIFLGFEVRLD